jgi:1-deoxy-D-xylulose-5-phosphate synthase
VVAEENYLNGGAGEAIVCRAAELGAPVRVKRLGVSDRFVQHATIDQQRRFCDLTAESVLKSFLNEAGPRARVHTA